MNFQDKIDRIYAMLNTANTSEEYLAVADVMNEEFQNAYEAGAKLWMDEYDKLKAKYETPYGLMSNYWNDGHFNWVEISGVRYKIVPEEQ